MPQRDSFGEPIPKVNRLCIISPIITKEPPQFHWTDAARHSIGAQAVQGPSNSPLWWQRDIGRVPLSPEYRDVYGEVAGHQTLRAMLAKA